MENRHFLNSDCRIWIGNSLSLIKPATYDHYRIITNQLTGERLVIFCKADGEEDIHSLGQKPVYIEHQVNINKIAKDKRVNNLFFREEGAVKPRMLDRLYPFLSRDMVPTEAKEATSLVITANMLERGDYEGLLVRNAGHTTIWPLSKLSHVIRTPHLDTVSVYWTDERGDPKCSTYNLSKVSQVSYQLEKP